MFYTPRAFFCCSAVKVYMLAFSLLLDPCQWQWPEVNPPTDFEQHLWMVTTVRVPTKGHNIGHWGIAGVVYRQSQNERSFFSTTDSTTGPWRQVKRSLASLWRDSGLTALTVSVVLPFCLHAEGNRVFFCAPNHRGQFGFVVFGLRTVYSKFLNYKQIRACKQNDTFF